MGENAPSNEIYRQIRDRAIRFELVPGQRINEVQLAKELSASRTPLREAMNRLVSEGLLTKIHKQGFFCRRLDAKSIFDLYELRCGIECHSVGLACERATDESFLALREFVEESARAPEGSNSEKLLGFDERFHETIAQLTGNSELLEDLKRLNARIYFSRWIDMRGRRVDTQREHLAIVDALISRKPDVATDLMRHHISRRMDQIVDVVREGFSTIYMRESNPATQAETAF